ncbi:MAG: GTP-binding protein, partial [Candidatus Latescibacterota bacterium]
MKEYTPDKIRNIALIGHQDTGKTMVSEAILYVTGATSRMGRVEDGNTMMDTTPEETERQISIQASLAYCEFKNNKINLLDTPGYEDFVGEVVGALDVVECTAVLIRADGGVEVGTEKVWDYARTRNLPSIFCVNKMDKEHADFDKCIQQLQEHFGRSAVPVQIPIGQGDSFKGIVDLLSGKAYEYTTDGKGKCTEVDIPDDIKDKADAMRRELLESAAENDEELMEKYLESETLTTEEACKGLAVGVAAGDVYPVFCMSAETNIGTVQFLEGIVNLAPSPVDRPQKLADSEEVLAADASEPAAAKVFKNISESHVGDMLFLRVFQGTLAGGSDIFNSTRNASDRLGQLFHLQGKTRSDTGKLTAGDLGAAVKLKEAHIGDTLCTKAKPVEIPQTDYPKGTIFSAIEGAAKGDEDKIGAGLNRLKEEDPTFDVRVDNEIRQTLISGQGELHLDIIVGRLKSRYGVEVI